MNNKISPTGTPNTLNKRYSLASEYGTPKEADDSDSSLYYSFSLSENDGQCKENSWSVTDSPSRIPKIKTPLLRMILQPNYTPRNKNNKRVSFSYQAKENPIPSSSGKIPKLQSKPETHSSGDLYPSSVFDMMSIGEHLSSILEKDSTNENLNTTVNGVDLAVVNDSASDITDDLENDLHNTIIENPSSTTKSVAELNNSITLLERPTGVVQKPESIETSDWPNKNSAHLKTVDEILHEPAKKESHTRNTAKVNRQRLANEIRKSTLPVKTARATTYKRRSSTYEPRKVDPRKSLGVLKHAMNKATKSLTGVFTK